MSETTEGAAAGAAAGTLISPGLGTIIGAGIGAAGSIAGSYLSGKSAKKAAAQANALSIWQQKQAQKWQEYMSNTAHQREVEDLKKAGLNPVLSANSGASAGSVGIGNTPAYESTDYTSAAKGAAEGFEKALALKSMENQTDITKADIDLKHKTGEETDAKKELAQAEKEILNIKKPAITAQANAEQAQAKLDKETAEYNSENLNNPLFRGIKAFSDITSMALGPIAQMVNIATTGAKANALKEFAGKRPPVNTLEEKYDKDGNSLGFKVKHWDR